MGLFYTYNGMVGLRDPKWPQGALNVPIGLFQRCGLVVNVTKSKVMTCQPGEIRYDISEEAVG